MDNQRGKRRYTAVHTRGGKGRNNAVRDCAFDRQTQRPHTYPNNRQGEADGLRLATRLLLDGDGEMVAKRARGGGGRERE